MTTTTSASKDMGASLALGRQQMTLCALCLAEAEVTDIPNDQLQGCKVRCADHGVNAGWTPDAYSKGNPHPAVVEALQRRK